MEIYINESSFHGQIFEKSVLEQGFKVFFSVLDVINQLQTEYRLYHRDDLLYVYKAFNNEVLTASLNNLRDQSLHQAILSVLFDRLHAKDWRHEQVHSTDDSFLCDEERVTDTSIAEVAERTIQNQELLAILINFPSSRYTGKAQLCVIKNEVHTCNVNCAEEKTRITEWLSTVLNLRDFTYDRTSTDPPQDYQTVLKDVSKFERTRYIESGKKVYKELKTGHYWYIDNLHAGGRAHLEVFDTRGDHLGEATLEGDIIPNSQDKTKKIDL